MSQTLAICLIFLLPISLLHAEETAGTAAEKKANNHFNSTQTKATSTTPAPRSEKDTGKEKVGQIQATLYIGTNEEVAQLGDKAKQSAEVSQAMLKQLQGIEKMRFKHYRQLGKDTQSVFRSYENWLSPLKPSEEILLSFESRGRSSDGGLRLDLEFWQQHRKVMKSDPVLHLGKPLIILGPHWRGGTLIIVVELIDLSPKK